MSSRICKVHSMALSSGCGLCLLDILCSTIVGVGRRRYPKTTLKSWHTIQNELAGRSNVGEPLGDYTERNGAVLKKTFYYKFSRIVHSQGMRQSSHPLPSEGI